VGHTDPTPQASSFLYPHPTLTTTQEPYGVFIPVAGQTGLTPAAEMMNGRMAMFGLIVLVLGSCVSGKDILEVFDVGVGGLYGLAK